MDERLNEDMNRRPEAPGDVLYVGVALAGSAGPTRSLKLSARCFGTGRPTSQAEGAAARRLSALTLLIKSSLHPSNIY